MFHFTKICITLLLLIFLDTLYAQSNHTDSTYSFSLPDSGAKVNIHNIVIGGNKVTKSYLIEREIPFRVNDSIIFRNVNKELEQARQLVYNTTLFNEVKLTAKFISSSDMDVMVEVKERWYIYPVPQFQLVDRNVNEWIKIHNADLNRVNYGIKFIDYNLSGRRDQLQVYLLNGYSRNVSFRYSAPYSNSKLTEGFSVSAGFSRNREIPYKTSYHNGLLFYKNDRFVRENWFASAGYILRRGYYVRHVFSASYSHASVSDTVIQPNYNPNYFKKAASTIGFPDFSYLVQYVNVNNIIYPLKGKLMYMAVSKRGLGFNNGLDMLSLEGGYHRYWKLAKKWYPGIQSFAKIKLPFDQAYINQRGLGYGDTYLRGLEYYVIDGVVTGLFKSTLKKEILHFTLPLPIKSKSYSKIPVTFFAKVYADAGYVYNKKQYDTFLNDKFLYTGGGGIDVFTIYDLTVSFEYSLNQLGEKGLFLHVQSAF